MVIPAKDEQESITSTVEHLSLELKLHGIPHEIIVMDDGSPDATSSILQSEAAKIAELRRL